MPAAVQHGPGPGAGVGRGGHRAGAGTAFWRGEPLADMSSDELALRRLPRLTELRLQAVEARIEADLHLGRQAQVIAELQGLASAHPTREPLHGLLMLALYRVGRRGEALACYQQARHVLAEELGTEPGTALHDLHQQILACSAPLSSSNMRFSLPPDSAAFTGRAAELDRITGTVLDHT